MGLRVFSSARRTNNDFVNGYEVIAPLCYRRFFPIWFQRVTITEIDLHVYINIYLWKHEKYWQTRSNKIDDNPRDNYYYFGDRCTLDVLIEHNNNIIYTDIIIFRRRVVSRITYAPLIVFSSSSYLKISRFIRFPNGIQRLWTIIYLLKWVHNDTVYLYVPSRRGTIDTAPFSYDSKKRYS